MTYQLLTDSCCDLPYQLLKEKDIAFISMTITLDGKEYIDDLGESFDSSWIMTEIQKGGMPTTSQINIGTYVEVFRQYVEAGMPVLYLAFSSGMSGSYNSAIQAVEILKEEYDTVEVFVVDTKAASVGQGMLVLKAAELRDAGHSIADILNWTATHKMNVQSWVTVDDLKHLERGGRISKAAAAFGSLINVKPIITVSPEGKLEAVGKVRGRIKSLHKVVEESVKRIKKPAGQTIYIAYAGDYDSAVKTKELFEQAVTVQNIEILPLGPTIASHTGYGCIAVFSMGESR